MLTRAHVRRPGLSNRNFNSEITGYLKMFLNSAFLKYFKWKDHFYFRAFCLCPCQSISFNSRFSLVNFIFRWSLCNRQNLENIYLNTVSYKIQRLIIDLFGLCCSLFLVCITSSYPVTGNWKLFWYCRSPTQRRWNFVFTRPMRE